MNNKYTAFCRIIRSRSIENQKSFNVLLESGSLAVAIGVLRQELDSLIRVSYLCEVGAVSSTAQALIEDTVNGAQWKASTKKGKERRITDREMVHIASKIGGWVSLIYEFGCRAVHLSNLHDHEASDPFVNVIDEFEAFPIIFYLSQYHGYPDEDIDKQRLVAYLPQVMQKLVSNVRHYVDEIGA